MLKDSPKKREEIFDFAAKGFFLRYRVSSKVYGECRPVVNYSRLFRREAYCLRRPDCLSMKTTSGRASPRFLSFKDIKSGSKTDKNNNIYFGKAEIEA
jgi:hypothetical protein